MLPPLSVKIFLYIATALGSTPPDLFTSAFFSEAPIKSSALRAGLAAISVKNWGQKNSGRSNPGEFNNPRGVTVNNKFLYICDSWNHRIQILTKNQGIFHTQWGSGKPSEEMGHFRNPTCIYYGSEDALFYIGDSFTIQLFKEEGMCIQQIGDIHQGNKMNQFSWITGVCSMDNQLFLSDYSNARIQLFK